jgi:uncharacterized protein (DUF697 family)
MIKTATRLTAAATELLRGVESVDRRAAHRRVVALRKRFPRVGKDELHKSLVYAKCLQTGAVGALSGITGLIPGIGPLASRVLGPLADATVISRLQAELIAETFDLYEVELPPAAERVTVLTLAATHSGAREASAGIARTIAQQAQRWLGNTLTRGVLPLARAATDAAAHVATTYAIGMRAKTLAKMRHAELTDWPDLLRQATLIDERRIAEWATKATMAAFDQARAASRLWLAQLGSLMDEAPPPLPAVPQARRKQRRAAARRKPRRRSAE